MTQQEDLIAHWPLQADAKEATGAGLTAVAKSVEFDRVDGHAAGKFNGATSSIEVPHSAKLQLGGRDFSIALWINGSGDVIGDLVNQFDHKARCGFNLMVQTQTGMTQTTQSNYRHVQFGIDNAQIEQNWTDCGRPGQAVQVSCMASIEGDLYVGTFENAPKHIGHLMCYCGGRPWQDMGAAPPGCNSVGSITYHNGAIYAATGRYDPNGSVLGNPLNPQPGGEVYRIENGKWIDCGKPGTEGAAPDNAATTYRHSDQADETICLTSCGGELFAVSNHRRGVHRYLGEGQWKNVGPDMRIMSLTIHGGELLALINGGGVYRYEDDDEWTYRGAPPRSRQTYCAVTYRGQLHVGTWPECEVIRYEGGEDWKVIGRVGYEREVMATALYNGKCYFGTLPMANVFRMDDGRFTFMGNLDNDPNYYLRRVWSMAVHKGRLFAGTLPSGRVLSRQFGVMATHDFALCPGWRHIAAVREGERLKIYLDGNLVTTSTKFRGSSYDLNNDQPLRIGHGIGHALSAALRDVRIYKRALGADDVAKLVSN